MLQDVNEVQDTKYLWPMAEELKDKKVIWSGTSSYQLVKQDILKAFFQNENFNCEVVPVLNF
jgi:hypothetical protein